MATAAVQIPSHNRVEPGSYPLQPAVYPISHAPPETDVHKIASEWAASLSTTLESQDYSKLKQLFLPGSCWRDQLALSWDYHTFNGPEKIFSFLKSSPHGSRIKSISIDDSSALHAPHVSAADFNGKVNGVESFLNIETDVGKGPGIVRLLQDQQDGGKWKAFTLFTAMHELRGHEETVRGNRPHGVAHGGQPGRKNWQERRQAIENFEGDLEPTVLILGNSTLTRNLGESWLTTIRRWTGWVNCCCTSSSVRCSNINHRPQCPSRRQLAEQVSSWQHLLDIAFDSEQISPTCASRSCLVRPSALRTLSFTLASGFLHWIMGTEELNMPRSSHQRTNSQNGSKPMQSCLN